MTQRCPIAFHVFLTIIFTTHFFPCNAQSSFNSTRQINPNYSNPPGRFNTTLKQTAIDTNTQSSKEKYTGIVLTETNNCKTYTYSSHLQAPTGDSLMLIDISPMLSGETVVATNQFRLNNKSILLIKLGQDGSIIQQLQLRVDNRPVIGTNMQVRKQNEVLLTGYFSDNNNQIFLAALTLDLQIKWVKSYDIDAAVELMKSDLRSAFSLSIVAQTKNSYKVLKLKENGEVTWATSLTRAPGTGLKNINYQATDMLLISKTDTSGTQPAYIHTSLQGTDGKLMETKKGEHQQDTVIITDFKGFDNRFASAGIVKKTDGKTIMFVSHAQHFNTEFYSYYYTLPSSLTLQSTVLVSPALDASAAYDSKSSQLYLITQNYNDNIRPIRLRQFDISGQHQFNSFVKTVDAGFMFGFSATDGQILLMKTDSAGMLPGCDSRTLQVGFEFVGHNQITLSNNLAQSSLPASPKTETISTLAGAGKMAFNCREKYCPTLPVEDSCTPSFFKILKSNYFGSGVYSGFFQKNILYTYGQLYEDISSPSFSITGMLGTYDLKGNHIKSAKTYINDAPAASNLWPYKNSHVLSAYSIGSNNDKHHFLIGLFNESLEPEWTIAIESYYTWNSYTLSPVVTDMVYDENGDIFVIIVQSNFNVEDNNISIIKLSAAGQFIWSKTYQINNRYSGGTNATITPAALVILSECIQPGAFTLAIDKNDGTLLAKNSLANNTGNSVTIESNRLFKYHNGKIYYAGTYSGSSPEASGIAAAILSPLGQPETFYYYVSSANSRVDAAMTNDKIDIVSASNLMSGYKTIKMQLNLALEVVHAFGYPTDYYHFATGVMYDSIGNTHEIGFLFAPDVYYQNDHYLKKYNPDGSIGSCAKEPIPITAIKVNLVDHPTNILPSNKTFQPGGNFQLQMFAEDNGLKAAKLQCLSQPTCTTLELDGAGAYCDPMKEYVVQIQKTAGCSLPVNAVYDTAVIKDVMINQSEIRFKTNRPGATWLKALLNTGCKFIQDSILITVPNIGATLELGPDSKICPKDSIVLNAGDGFVAYNWSNGSNANSIKVKDPGTYWVAATDGCGTIKRDTVVISAAQVPALSAGADTSVCLGTSINRIASSGFVTYQWTRLSDQTRVSNSNNILQDIYQNESFSITAFTADGCMEADSFKVIMKSAKPFNLGADTSICKGDSMVFSAPAGYSMYRWNTGNNSQKIVAKQAGFYSVSATEANGCTTADTIRIIQLYEIPTPQLGPDKSICIGTAILLNPGSYVRYQWQDGTNSTTQKVSKLDWYWVKVWNEWDCQAVDSMRITALLPIPQNFLKNTDSICQYESLRIEPNRKFATYAWSTGSSNEVITTTQPGIFTLRVTDNNGCIGLDSILVVKKSCMEGVYVPNAFTPNKDGKNDNFKPLVFGKVRSYEFKIFNRYGEIVFSSTLPGEAWNGLWKGLPQPAGSFVWQCHYQLEGKDRMQIKGTVILIR